MSLLFFSFPIFVIPFNTPIKQVLVLIKRGMKSLFPSMDFYSTGLISFFSGIFLFFSIINLFSLLPYIFSPLAHIILTLSIRLILWGATIFYQFIYFLKNKTIHLTPKGTPI